MVEAEDSGGLPRMAGPAKDYVKGSINNRPFRPGGLDNSQVSERIPVGASNGQWVWEVINGGPPQTIPPSFKQGLDLGDLRVNLLDQCHLNRYSSSLFFILIHFMMCFPSLIEGTFILMECLQGSKCIKSTSAEKQVSICSGVMI